MSSSTATPNDAQSRSCPVMDGEDHKNPMFVIKIKAAAIMLSQTIKDCTKFSFKAWKKVRIVP